MISYKYIDGKSDNSPTRESLSGTTVSEPRDYPAACVLTAVSSVIHGGLRRNANDSPDSLPPSI